MLHTDAWLLNTENLATIFRIFAAIVSNVAVADVVTPLSVMASATNAFPSLTD